MQHYRRELDLLKQNGITPMVTLHHFSQPIWFDEMGGWEKEENLEYFVRFCEYVYSEFCDDVPYWCTINEPTVFCLVGYLQGSFPPVRRA
jgi:beta-glucosidase